MKIYNVIFADSSCDVVVTPYLRESDARVMFNRMAKHYIQKEHYMAEEIYDNDAENTWENNLSCINVILNAPSEDKVFYLRNKDYDPAVLKIIMEDID